MTVPLQHRALHKRSLSSSSSSLANSRCATKDAQPSEPSTRSGTKDVQVSEPPSRTWTKEEAPRSRSSSDLRPASRGASRSGTKEADEVSLSRSASRRGKRSPNERKRAAYQAFHEHEARTYQEHIYDGGNSMEAFSTALKRRFGSVTAAWRLALDKDRKGRVSFVEFCQLVRELGYTKNVKAIWNTLDADGSGFITLNELDPRAARELDDFMDFITEKFGNTLQAWKHLDYDGNNRLDLLEFEEQCKKIGFTGNSRYVFNCLKIDVSKAHLSLKDLDPEAHIAQMRGDTEMFMQKVRPKFTGTLPTLDQIMNEKKKNKPTAKGDLASHNHNTEWVRAKSLEQRRLAWEAKQKLEHADLGAKSIDGLRKALIVRYGNLYAAWRQGLDLDGNGRLSFSEFCLALREFGYAGSVKKAWYSLDLDKDGFIQLGDLDPEIEKMVVSYQELVTARFGHMLAGWMNDLCKEGGGNGSVELTSFKKHCERIGWSGDEKLLFEMLKNDRTRKFMRLSDYDTTAHQAFMRGDLEMITAQPSPREGNFEERNLNTFRLRWSRSQAKTQIAERIAREEDEKARDKGAQDVSSMKEMFTRKYGTTTAAWRHAFDTAGEDGKVGFVDFCRALRSLGFAGDIRECWSALGGAKKGTITLKDLDAEAYECIHEFRTILLNKYGNYIKAWQHLDANRNNQLEEDEVIDVCKEIGFTKDPKKLFKLMLDHPGKKHIAMEDIDPGAMRAFYRGDLEAMSPQEKGKAKLAERAAAEQKEKAKILAANDYKSLLSCLNRKFGSLTAAWRYGLDLDGVGKLSFVAFCAGARSVGFVGNMRRAFSKLDDDGSGVITFNEIDPVWFKRHQTFQDLLYAKYQSYEAAWDKIDEDKSNAIERHEFLKLCDDLGYPGDAAERKELFRQMLPPFGRRMSLHDLEVGIILLKAVTGFSMAKRNSDLLSEQERGKLEILRKAQEHEDEKHRRMAANDLKGMRHELIRKYGTLTAAWRWGLDVTGNGKISFVDFCKACRDRIGFIGDFKACFAELDADGGGIITFNELDPKNFARLRTFQELLHHAYWTYESAWNAMDTNHNNQIDMDEFVEVCIGIGFPGGEKEAQALFQQLLKNKGVRVLAMEDLHALEIIVSTVTGVEMAFRDDDLLTHDQLGQKELERRAQQKGAHYSKDIGANNLEALKAELIKKFGTVTAAWRHQLDRSCTGKLPWMVFAKSCRDIAFTGNIKAAFHELDEDNSGVVNFKEIAPDVYTQLVDFHRMLLREYGDYEEAWDDMDTNGNKNLDQNEFSDCCRDLGYKGNASLIYKQHLDHLGAQGVKFEDVAAVGMIIRKDVMEAIEAAGRQAPSQP